MKNEMILKVFGLIEKEEIVQGKVMITITQLLFYPHFIIIIYIRILNLYVVEQLSHEPRQLMVLLPIFLSSLRGKQNDYYFPFIFLSHLLSSLIQTH